jgi:hypothetical protein
VRLSHSEQETVVPAAAAAGVSVPYLLVETTLASLAGVAGWSVAERRAVAVELSGMWRQFHTIGGNVEQLAEHANAGRIPARASIEGCLGVVVATTARLQAVLDRLDGRGRS